MVTALPFERTRDSLPTRKYPRAPIVEALVDIHVEAPSAPDIAALALVMAGEKERYPRQDNLVTASISVNPAAGVATSAAQQLIGFRYVAPTPTVVQVRANGFAFSRLAPYPADGWEEWVPEAKRLWQRYVEATNVRRVVRLAVRYINKIDIPCPAGEAIEPEEYFATFPRIAEGIGNMTTFLMRTELEVAGLEEGGVNLTQGILEEPGNPETIPVLLDIDVFESSTLEASSPEVWLRLERLHQRENEIFEACITPATQRLFQ